MTGLFEYLNPLLAVADSLFAWLPPFARIAFWGVMAGAASMALYVLVSPQERLNRLAEESRAGMRAMRAQDRQSEDHGAEMGGAMKASLERFALSLGPALLSALPILFMIGYLNATYGLKAPVPGEPVAILSEDASSIVVEGGQKFAAGWTVAWPRSGEAVRVFDASGRHIYSITSDTRPGTARKSGVLAFLLGAQAGTLAPQSPIESLEVETTPQAILQPERSFHFQWAVPFILAVLLSSLLVKVVFRIS